ncbi:MAG: hypothetical protein ACSLE5_05645 [Porticoccaceae bacterium]
MRLPTKWLVLIALVLNGVAFYWFDAQQKQWPEQTQIASAGAVRDRESGGAQLFLLSEHKSVAASKPEQASASDQDAATAQFHIQAPNLERTAAVVGDAEHQEGESIQSGAAFGRAAVARGCWSLGPFAMEGDAAALARELAVIGVNANVRTQDKKTKPRIWVYLPAPASPTTQAEQLKRLRDKGIDHFVFAEGELEGSISLGLYITLKDAEKWQQELALQGYDAKIHTASSDGVAWVDFPPGAGKYMVERAATAMKGAYPGLRLEAARACVQSSAP